MKSYRLIARQQIINPQTHRVHDDEGLKLSMVIGRVRFMNILMILTQGLCLVNWSRSTRVQLKLCGIASMN